MIDVLKLKISGFSSLCVFNVSFTREVFNFKVLFSFFQCFLTNHLMRCTVDGH